MVITRLHGLLAVICGLSLYAITLLLGQISESPRATLESLLPQADLAALHRVRASFGIDVSPVLITLEGETAQQLQATIGLLEPRLREIDGVQEIFSTPFPIPAANSRISTTATPPRFIVFVLLQADVQRLNRMTEVANRIDTALAVITDNSISHSVVGIPQIRRASWLAARDDIKELYPLLIGIIVLVSMACFASLTALFLALTMTSLTVLICLAIQVAFIGEAHTLLAIMIPIIASIATLDAFHLISAGLNKKATRELLAPCSLTTFTTAGCFATLVLQDSSALLVTFGLWGMCGSIVAFGLTFTLGAWLLRLSPSASTHPAWPRRLALRAVVVSSRYCKTTIAVWGLALLASLAALPAMVIDNNYPNVFADSVPLASDIRALQELTGTDLSPIDIIIDATDSHGKNPDALISTVLAISNYARTLAETRIVLPVDLIDTSTVGNIADRSPQTYMDHKQARLWINPDAGMARVQLHMENSSYQRKREIIDWLDHFDRTMLGHHGLTLTDTGYLYTRAEQRGIQDLIFSTLVCILLVACTMAWITRTAFATLVGLGGCLVPGILVIGLMALLPVPWSIALLPLPVLLIGLMADDTIHLLWRGRSGAGLNLYQLKKRTAKAAHALIATSLVLSSAVLILTLSSMQVNRQLGLLLPIGLMLALAYNLTLIPALSSFSHRSFPHPRP